MTTTITKFLEQVPSLLKRFQIKTLYFYLHSNRTKKPDGKAWAENNELQWGEFHYLKKVHKAIELVRSVQFKCSVSYFPFSILFLPWFSEHSVLPIKSNFFNPVSTAFFIYPNLLCWSTVISHFKELNMFFGSDLWN